MDGKRLIEKIRLRNILSFGDKGEELELQPLNVLIGPNASGKSNLVDIFRLLRSRPTYGLVNLISKSGGIDEWLWKGKKTDNVAEIEVHTIEVLESANPVYTIKFGETFQRVSIFEETIKEKDAIILRNNGPKAKDYLLSVRDEDTLTADLALLILYLLADFEVMAIYSDLQTNRKSEMRRPQLPDARNNFLEDDASNLSLVLSDLEHRGETKDKIVENLKKFYPRIKDYEVRNVGDYLQLFIHEEGLKKPISAMRLSDGTLRYLCLLTILCHPKPPPLICIEEPETGLHPDVLPTIAELMIEASQRTQLIVTTHSDILVSALSEVPEAVVVCEHDEDGTHFRRLEKENLKEWLEEYSLGELWLKGEIGGTRW